MKIFLIYGGKSAESDISVISAFSIQNEIYYDQHEVVPIYINQQGEWLTTGGRTTSFATKDDMRFTIENGAVLVEPTILKEENSVALPCLHGPNGEDGTIQGLFEVYDIPYVGCGVLASAAGMDKIMSKYLFQQIGLPQLPYVPVVETEWHQYPESIFAKCEGTLIYPMFVKPANLGSSVGISKANNREELIAALNVAFAYDHRVVVELGIDAREVECAVLGDTEIHTSVVGELVKDQGFYDYEEKYINNTVDLAIPANIKEEISDKIRRYSTEAFQVLDGSGLARCDFFLTANDEIYINEVNTFPGFTPYSMYPKLWEATGIQYGDLVETLIDLAKTRHARSHSKKHQRIVNEESNGETIKD
ncbi:D-alanine--D-alanine ligase family protein [Atopobacter phocae]|uniref:D-alanine--D-alanine ligase family protein n=1 Tax=Atopobacter phocae TaxID=136492 RepID=UPI00046F30EF|nr:D-alanine--D-alanine ligase family protein [Atopobacter phocae]